MIKLKDLIKEWNDTSFKDLPKRWSGAYENPDSGLTEFEQNSGKDIVNELVVITKPEKNHYIRDGKIFGKIVKFESWKGMKLAYIDPQSGMHQDYKGGSLVGYDMSKLKDSKKRNVGKPIWIPK